MANLADIAKQHNFITENFIAWAKKSKYSTCITSNFWSGDNVDDSKVSALVEDYNEELRRRKIEADYNARMKAEKEAKKRAILITSGYNFEGYKIVKYSGYISGDDAVNVNRDMCFFNTPDTADKLMNSLVQIRRKALDELKEAAFNLGCNAVIGVDFDYLTLEPETANFNGGTTYLPYVFGVTANGNAVVIEKIDD